MFGLKPVENNNTVSHKILHILQFCILLGHMFINYSPVFSESQHSSRFCSVQSHLYADDTQVHNSFNTSSFNGSIRHLLNSLVSVEEWMYKKKLNADNTEFLLIGIKCHHKDFASSFPIDILGNNISPTPTTRNVGIISCSDFKFFPHTNSIVKEFQQPHAQI